MINGTVIQDGLPTDHVLPFLDEAVAVADWAASPSGYTVRLSLIADHAVHPFRGLIRPGTGGQRILLSVSAPEGNQDVDATCSRIIYDDQAIVTWRGDDSINGMSVSIRLDTTHGGHPFASITSRVREGSGGRAILHAQAWIVDEQEKLTKLKVGFAELSPVTQSARLCASEPYIAWIIENARYLMRLCGAESLHIPENAPKSETAAILTRAFIGVPSRKILEDNTREGFDARMKWNLLLMLYKERNGTEAPRRYDARTNAAPR